MPNPKAIDVPQLGFSDEQKDVLHADRFSR